MPPLKLGLSTWAEGNLALLRRVIPLMFLLLCILLLRDSSVSAVTCDIPDPEDRTRFLCRNVPDYFIDNVRAKMRLMEARVAERKSARAEGREEANFVVFDFGYRCPDAQGECNTEWIYIPSPGGVNGLSGPNNYSGSSGFGPGAHIQRIGGDGIGDPAILAQNPIDAIDVWGEGAVGEVCFYGDGRLQFVNTAVLPRTQSSLSTYKNGDSTCAQISGPGQVIFLPNESSEAEESSTPSPSGTPTPAGDAEGDSSNGGYSSRALSGCQVTANENVNLRAAPGGDVLGMMPSGSTVSASERTVYWFKVSHDGRGGWVSVGYVTTSGDCD